MGLGITSEGRGVGAVNSQVHDGLNWPSQHTLRPLEQPQTPS